MRALNPVGSINESWSEGKLYIWATLTSLNQRERGRVE